MTKEEREPWRIVKTTTDTKPPSVSSAFLHSFRRLSDFIAWRTNGAKSTEQKKKGRKMYNKYEIVDAENYIIISYFSAFLAATRLLFCRSQRKNDLCAAFSRKSRGMKCEMSRNENAFSYFLFSFFSYFWNAKVHLLPSRFNVITVCVPKWRSQLPIHPLSFLRNKDVSEGEKTNEKCQTNVHFISSRHFDHRQQKNC